MLETLRLSDIIDDNTAISTSVESLRQRHESLLACSIPDLKYNGTTIIKRDLLVRKVSTDGWLASLLKASIIKHLDQGSLPYERVPDDHDFHKVLTACIRDHVSWYS